MDEVVTLTSTLTHAREYGHAAVILGYALNHFLNQHGLAYACPTEEANLSAQYIGSEQIDNLNSGFEHLGLRFQLIERGRIAVNRPTFFNIEGLALFQVEAVAGHVKYVSLGNIAYRNRNGSSRIGYLLSAHQPISGLKR